MTISFARLREYLDAIAANPAAMDIAGSPHGPFWRIDHDLFVHSDVPNVLCTTSPNNPPIPIVVSGDSGASPLWKILSADRVVCGKRQMPRGGPFATDPGYSITLASGEVVIGAQILADIAAWITANCPEMGNN